MLRQHFTGASCVLSLVICAVFNNVLPVSAKVKTCNDPVRFELFADAMILRYGSGETSGNAPLALKSFEELAEGPVDDITLKCWVEMAKIHLFYDARGYILMTRKYEEAIKLFKKAEQLGEPEAKYFLSFLHTLEINNGVAKDDRIARMLLKQSASLKYPPALLTLAYKYLYGIVSKTNIKLAISLYKSAFKLNSKKNEVLTQMSPIEELRLSDMALEPFKTPLEKRVQAETRQRKEAMQYWQGRADGGDPLAMYELGKLMEYDPQSEYKAADLYKKASENGVLAATRDTGVCYMNGIGVRKNGEKAVEYLKKAVDLGDPEAAKYLGYLYYTGMEKPDEGKPIKRDYKKAKSYLIMAAKQEIPEAMYLLGEILYNRCLGISLVKSKKKLKAAYKMYRMAADYGLMQALAREAHMLANGLGVKKDLFKAALRYKQLAEAPFTVTTVTDSFNAYVAKDYKSCFLYNALASYAGISAAQYNLGRLQLENKGMDVAKNSKNIVLDALKQCSKQGDIKAYYLLGWIADSNKRYKVAEALYKTGYRYGDLDCLDPLATLLGREKETRDKAIKLLEYKQHRMANEKHDGSIQSQLCSAVNKFDTWKRLSLLRAKRALDYYRRDSP